VPIKMVKLSKAWVCGRLLAGIVCSNPARQEPSVSGECCVLLGVSASG
jgi:hypothetical protein